MRTIVGKRIRSLRKEKDLSQEEIADRLSMSRSAYERMENGKSHTWASKLENLSEIFDVSPEYFVQDEEKNVMNSENQEGGLALQNNGSIEHVHNLSERLIGQYESHLAEKDERLREKEELIQLLQDDIRRLKEK